MSSGQKTVTTMTTMTWSRLVSFLKAAFIFTLLPYCGAFSPLISAAKTQVGPRRHSAECPLVVATPRPRGLAASHHDNDNDKNEFGAKDHDDHDVESSSFIATCVPGLSHILAQELRALGCKAVTPTGTAAVHFMANGTTALQCLVWARTPHKIMEFLVESPPTINTRQELHEFVYDVIHVQSLLGNGQGGLLTLSVSTILNAPRQIPVDINHSHYTALTVKNALCDAVRDLRGDRPSVDLDNPDVPLVAVVRGTPSGAQVSLYRQLHGQGSLHKRGYRPATIHKAALKESLAAGLLWQASWHETCRLARQSGATPPLLLDPMAGSGTLALEGLLMAADLAPHLMRIKTSGSINEAAVHQLPPMLRWRDFGALRHDVWPQLLRQATQRGKAGIQWLRNNDNNNNNNNNNNGPCVYVNDLHTGALSLLDESLAIMGLADQGLVEINAGDCADWKPNLKTQKNDNGEQQQQQQHWTVVCNPPWGVRLDENVDASWEALRIFLKQQCPAGHATAWILSGNAQATKRLGLRRSHSMPVKVGTQDLRWLQYEIREHSSDDKIFSKEKENVPRKTQNNAFPERNIRATRSFRSRDTAEKSDQQMERGNRKPSVRLNKGAERKHESKPQAPSTAASNTNEWLID